MVRRFPGTAGALLALTLLLAASACDPNGSASTGGGGTVVPSPGLSTAPTATPTPTPTRTPAPTATPTKKPFFPALASVGGSTFAQVTGAPVQSVCSVRAFLRPSGPEISGSGLKPRTVTKPSTGASWDSNNGDQLLKPGTASGQHAYWQFTCANTAYDPISRVITRDFDTP
jgi:hypothetical protein